MSAGSLKPWRFVERDYHFNPQRKRGIAGSRTPVPDEEWADQIRRGPFLDKRKRLCGFTPRWVQILDTYCETLDVRKTASMIYGKHKNLSQKYNREKIIRQGIETPQGREYVLWRLMETRQVDKAINSLGNLCDHEDWRAQAKGAELTLKAVGAFDPPKIEAPKEQAYIDTVYSEIPPQIIVWKAKYGNWPEGDIEEALENGLTVEQVEEKVRKGELGGPEKAGGNPRLPE